MRAPRMPLSKRRKTSKKKTSKKTRNLRERKNTCKTNQSADPEARVRLRLGRSHSAAGSTRPTPSTRRSAGPMFFSNFYSNFWLRSNFLANFERLVLGCIEAKFCKLKLVGKLSPRSTQCTPLHRFAPLLESIIENWGKKNLAKTTSLSNLKIVY